MNTRSFLKSALSLAVIPVLPKVAASVPVCPSPAKTLDALCNALMPTGGPRLIWFLGKEKADPDDSLNMTNLSVQTWPVGSKTCVTKLINNPSFFSFISKVKAPDPSRSSTDPLPDLSDASSPFYGELQAYVSALDEYLDKANLTEEQLEEVYRGSRVYLRMSKRMLSEFRPRSLKTIRLICRSYIS